MIPRVTLETVTLLAIIITCAHGLKIDFARLAGLRRSNFITPKRNDMCQGNPCDSSKPFLCRTSKCIPLKSVCDSIVDCEDGFDEEPLVCNAAARPPIEDLIAFIENERKWMVPKLFNGADPNMIAHVLIAANDMNDLREQLGLTDQNVELLRRAFEGAIEGDERPLLAMGMSDRSWHEVQFVFQKLLDSGFKY